jgi:exodeoxyribonuclease-1
MLRQAFYQNLQPDIFATQFNGNTRLDVLTSLYAVWYRQPDLFNWPVDETGRVRFKLDLLAPQNGFVAHNVSGAKNLFRDTGQKKVLREPRRTSGLRS